jgi:hypothetical protein
MIKVAACFVTCVACAGATAADAPRFTEAQPELFAPIHALSNAFADVDGDGDLDLAVAFADGAIRLYLNAAGRFSEAGPDAGLATGGPAIRGLAWGDLDGDGDPDLYAGASPEDAEEVRNLAYRNDGRGRFEEVAQSVGLAFTSADSRQSSWIDYDNDGDLDLFTGQRESRNRLFRNERGRFSDVSISTGLADPRKTVGACWFDFDADGDLDLFLANQDGGTDALWRNDFGRFTDVAPALGLNSPGRKADEGGVGCAVGDYDNDGRLDLFVATYGATLLYRNEGGGQFREVASEVGLRLRGHYVGASWGDADNDGGLDLYLAGYDDARSRDHLFMNRGGRFEDVLASESQLQASDHGVQWADIDADGDLDLSLTETFPATARHRLFRNNLRPEAGRSLSVQVLDTAGRSTRAGAEVRLYDADGGLIGTRVVPTGDGYGSQGEVPVHFGLVGGGAVTVEVTFMTRGGRRLKRVEGVDPADWMGRALAVRAD